MRRLILLLFKFFFLQRKVLLRFLTSILCFLGWRRFGFVLCVFLMVKIIVEIIVNGKF